MNFLLTLTQPLFSVGARQEFLKCDLCDRSIALKNPAVSKAGIRMHGDWYCSTKCFTAAMQRELSSLLRSRFYRDDPKPRMPLALSLVRRGVISEDEYKNAARVRKDTGREIGELLLSEGVITEEQLAAARAALWSCPYFDARELPAASMGLIPQSLVEAHGAVPLHYVNGTKTLLMGFYQAIEYGLLSAVERILGCKTEPCFISPSTYQTHLDQMKRTWVDSIVARRQEVRYEHVGDVTEIAHALCKKSVEFEADEVVVAQCKDYLWARLKSPTRETDLLFSA